MYPTSREFQEKIKQQFGRRTFGKVQIDYTSPFLDQSITVDANENANVSYPAQTADAVLEPFAKIPSLDGSWVLDGSFALAPGPDETDTHQMGWWGKQLAGTGGVFSAPYPILTVTFFPRPITKLQAVGDSKRQEWPVNFAIRLYDGNNTLLHTETVTGNTQIAWSKVLDEPITQVEKMALEIMKWSHAGRQAKILEFFTSIQEVYEGDDIILIHLLEEREVSQGSLPVGNISANEIDIRLFNSNRKFDAGNKQSSLYQLLKANRRIKAWLGVETTNGIEYVPLGTFWSGDWHVPEDGVYAETMGRDRLELLRKSTYSTSQVQMNKTLYELAESILQDAGLTEEEYYIDIELRQFPVPYAWFDSQSHREALRKVAEACLGQVYCDRHGVLRIEGPSYTSNKIQQLKGVYFLESAFPAESEHIEAYGIGPDDYFRKDNPVKWSEIANYIEVETQPLRPDVSQEVYRSNEPVSITAGQEQTIIAYYNHTPCIEATATLENAVSGAEITKATYYAWGADITVYSANTGTFELIINAKPLKVLNKEKAIAQDEESITDNGKLRYVFPANPLVQTREVAQKIADILLAYFKNPRRDVSIEWRGNPALLLGDVIVVPDYQNEKEDTRGYYYITKQELEFDGALRATLEGRRAL
jgi:hypothetical protein